MNASDTNNQPPEPEQAGSPAVTGSEVYEIVNPSDAYTIKAPFLVAAVAVAILGNGKYGIPGSPILFGWDKWIKKKVGDIGEYIDRHRTEIAAALDSVLIGNEADRLDVESALLLIPVDQREQWLSARHERLRTSMNNIGANARHIANQLRQPPNK